MGAGLASGTIRAMTIIPIQRFYAVAAVLAAIAGVLLFPLAGETDDFFSWTIEPPLSAAFMGAAYWAALVLLAWAARQRTWAVARTAMPAVATIAALLLAATLIHIDKFDFDSLFGWFWMVVYSLVTPLLAWSLVRQLSLAAPVERGLDPLPGAVRVILAIVALVFAGFGVALFAWPVDAASAWPWPLTPLTARAIASFLIGFAVAGAFALWEDDRDRLRGPARAFAALAALELLALLPYGDDLTAEPAGVIAYVAFWLISLALGAAGALSSSNVRTAPGSR
jgi:hypothetical protein